MIEPFAVAAGLGVLALTVVATWAWLRPANGIEPSAVSGGSLSWVVIMILTVATAFALIHGTDGILRHDEAVFVYTGSAVAEGWLPYEMAFDNTGPLGPWYHGVASWVGDRVLINNLTSSRLAYLPIALACAILIALVAFRAGVPPVIAFIASAALIALPSFTREILSGPRPKMLVILLELVLLIALQRQKWLVAGFAVSLAALAWQPAGLLIAVPFVVASAHMTPARGRAFRDVTIGASLPFAATVLIYGMRGRLELLWEGLISWNLIYAAPVRSSESLVDRIVDPLKDLWGAHQISWPLIVMGMAGLLWLAAREVRNRGLRQSVKNQPIVWVGMMSVIWVAWTLFDYQGVVDLFPFLPLTSLGVAFVAGVGASRRGLANRTMMAIVALVLLTGLIETVRTDDDTLVQQKEEVAQFVSSGDSVVSFDRPEILVLTGSTNPSRFFFTPPGLSLYLDEKGELEAYVNTLFGSLPEVVGASLELDKSIPLEARVMRELESAYKAKTGKVLEVWVKRVP